MSNSFVHINLLILLLSLFVSPAYPDTVTLKTGYIIKGLIIQEEGNKVIIKDKGGETTLKKEKILEINYNPDHLLDWADEYFKDRDYEKAISTYEEVLNSYKDRDDSILKYKIARCYLNLKLPNKAVPYLEELKESSKLGKKAEALLSDIREKREEEEKAGGLYKQAVEEYNKVKALGWNHANLAKYNKVIDNCKKIRRYFPDTEAFIGARRLILQCYEQQVKIEKRFKNEQTEEEYNKAEARFKEINQMKWSYKNLVLYDDILRECKKIRKKSNDPRLILNTQKMIIDCYIQQAEHKKSISELEKFISLSMKHLGEDYALKAMVSMAHGYLKKSREDLALVIYRNLSTYKKSCLLKKIADKYYFNGNYEYAYLIYSAFEKSENVDSEYFSYKSMRCLVKFSRLNEMIKNFKLFNNLYPESKYFKKLCFTVANIYLAKKAYKKAVEHYDKILEDDKKESLINIIDCLYWKGIALYKMQEYEKAKKIFANLNQNTSKLANLYKGNIQKILQEIDNIDNKG